MGRFDNNAASPRVTVIGGGSGTSNLIKGLRKFTSNISVIVTMFDSGGSSGLLRKEFGYPPFGDLRQCLLALSDESPDVKALRDALDFRFGKDSSLNGHSLGNLLLAALTSANEIGADGSWQAVEHAVQEVSRVLRIKGQVVPVTLESAELCAELEDGRVIRGESDIDLRGTVLPRIARIFLDRPVAANPRALKAILGADVIVLGPGDLYTSILPNLLVDGIVDAIAASQRTCVYICNLMTKRGETDGFAASDFVREVASHLAPAALDWTVVNTEMPSTSVLQAYAEEFAYPVVADLRAVRRHVYGVYTSSLASNDLPLRHDPDRTAAAIMQVMHARRPRREPARATD